MAQDFEQKSKAQASATEQQLKSDFNRFAQSIKEELAASEKNFKKDIRAYSRRMWWVTLKTWFWLFLSVVIVALTLWGIVQYQLYDIQSNYQQIRDQKETIQTLSAQGGNMSISHCGKTKQLCAQVRPELGLFGEDGENYMILKGN
ncbi:MAG: MbeB family mobilization protein [Luminiphilus sp.]